MNHEEMSHENQLSAAQHLPADLMLVKMEGEHIMTMAAAKRRPITDVIAEAQAMLKANPAAAQAAVYSKPVGLKPDVCKKCGHRVQRKGWQKFQPHCPECGKSGTNTMIEGKQQFARGLSIKAAESLANLVGYNRVATSFAVAGDGVYRCTSIFVDYSRGIIRSKERMVSQWRRKWKSTQLEKQDDERFLEMTLAGAASKNERNAMLAGMPFELRQAYEQAAMEVAPKYLNAEKIQEIIDAFAGMGVGLQELQVLLGRTKSEGWRAAEYETLRGVWVGLENGEMTVEELLDQCRAPEGSDESTEASQESPGEAAGDTKATRTRKKPATQAGAVTDELTGGTTAAEPEPERGDLEIANSKSAPPSKRTETPPPATDPPATKPAAAPPRTTGRAPADQTGPSRGPVGASAAAAEPAPPAANSASPIGPAGPQGAAGQPAGAPAPRKMTEAACISYMRARYEDSIGSFDLEGIAKRAIGQVNQTAFMDLILTRKNPNWQNFILREQPAAADEDLQPGLDFEGEASEPAAEQTEVAAETLEDPQPPEPEPATVTAPISVTDPLPRPTDMSEIALHMERQIVGYKQAKRIRAMVESHIQASQDLTADQASYLSDLADRRAWQLENNVTPTDALASNG